jgi:hypothetical protein
MCKFGELRLTPDEARELREATERLIRGGLAWLDGSTVEGPAPDDAVVPKAGAAGPDPASPFPPTP